MLQLKLLHEFNKIPTNISRVLSIELKLQFLLKCKGQRVKIILRGDWTIPGIKIYYQAVTMLTFWYRDGQTRSL